MNEYVVVLVGVAILYVAYRLYDRSKSKNKGSSGNTGGGRPSDDLPGTNEK